MGSHFQHAKVSKGNGKKESAKEVSLGARARDLKQVLPSPRERTKPFLFVALPGKLGTAESRMSENDLFAVKPETQK